ncbi:16S rRNA (uracil1498-N3)-methyltransferase [Parelusimicrobium proximum]|uniref:RsmE family RNA methyltransferase n=1 Tax=Parelusimicrobium proximum TaxID=3228953 RepID=UPI003D176A0E
MPQFLAEISESRFIIEGDEAKHLSSVMRAKAGDEIKVFDGKGRKFKAVIEVSDKKEVSGVISGEIKHALPDYKIILCFAPVSKGAVEEIIDKCTQLGVTSFRPVITELTEHDIVKKWDSKKERWHQIALSAAKQCECPFIPVIEEPVKFAEAVKIYKNKLIAYEKEGTVSLFTELKKLEQGSEVAIFTGPVGGFKEGEIAYAETHGAKTVTLGKNIMRAETAAIAACAIAGQ